MTPGPLSAHKPSRTTLPPTRSGRWPGATTRFPLSDGRANTKRPSRCHGRLIQSLEAAVKAADLCGAAGRHEVMGIARVRFGLALAVAAMASLAGAHAPASAEQGPKSTSGLQ